MSRNSPAVQAALDQWKQGYVPTAYSQRLFRTEYRQQVKIEHERLSEAIKECDALEIVANIRSFLRHVERLETQLRQSLAGDRHPDTDDARAAPRLRGVS